MRTERTKRPPSDTGRAAEPAAAVHVIDPNGVYFWDVARQLLRFKESTIRREVREGRLRVSKRAGRYFILGRWLIEWIEKGEVQRKRPTSENGNGEKTDH
jgi:hypothetical protein